MGRATREAVRKAVALISGVLACDGAPTRVCPHCGATVSAEARYCPQCGKKLPPVTEVPRCPKCDAPLPPGAKYCPHCGAKIER
ncbi:MAG: zinc-ribbon domain-containing protein [Armatimonadetes bacterium]|nr:zinc-ribbon domain-containing protein [Armatimonadota bacterium]